MVWNKVGSVICLAYLKFFVVAIHNFISPRAPPTTFAGHNRRDLPPHNKSHSFGFVIAQQNHPGDADERGTLKS